MAIAVPFGPSMAINGPRVKGHQWDFVKDDPIDGNRNYLITKVRSKRPCSKFRKILSAGLSFSRRLDLDLKTAVLVEKQFKYSYNLIGHRCICRFSVFDTISP